MTTNHLASLLLTLAACSTPALCGACSDGGGDDGGPIEELPNEFRVDAEIVSVEPGPGQPEVAASVCTPTTRDTNPDGPDWLLAFDDMHSATEPTFREVDGSTNFDSANRCLENGEADCCDPVAIVAGGWTMTCRGRLRAGDTFRNRFDFAFGVDGSGTSTTTRTRISNGEVICVAVAEWPALLPR